MKQRVAFSFLIAVGMTSCLRPVAEGETIGPAGGRVSANGVTLVVPPDALSMPTQVTISRSSAPAPPGTRAVGDAFLLGPEGQQFARPVTLELPLASEPSSLLVATAPANSQQFELLPATRSGLVARVQISHFSIFIPVTPLAAEDGGIDAGVDAGRDLLETCQANWEEIEWWSLGDAGSVDVTLHAAQTGVIELPGAWVFTIGPTVYSVDRTTLRLIDARNTFDDSPLGGSLRLNAVRFPSELLLVSSRGSGSDGYAEWRMDLNGRFKVNTDGGFLRELRLPGTHAATAGFNGLGPGSTAVLGWDTIVVAAGQGDAPTIGMVPRNPALPVSTVPLPVGPSDTTGATELPDGTVLIGMNTRTPPLPAQTTSMRTEMYELRSDGGLTALGWSVTQSPVWGQVLTAGIDGGAAMLTLHRTGVTVSEPLRPDVAWTGVIDAGVVWPISEPVARTPGGRILAILPLGQMPSRYGYNAIRQDLYLVTYPPGKVTLLATGLSSFAPPGIGAVREDSFVFAFYDELTGLHAARLCLPQ